MKKHWIVTEEPMAGYTWTNICRLLWQNRFRIHPKYYLRFLYGIAVSTLFLPLRIWETLTFSRKIEKTAPKQIESSTTERRVAADRDVDQIDEVKDIVGGNVRSSAQTPRAHVA